MIDSTQSPLTRSFENLSSAWTALKSKLNEVPANDEIQAMSQAVTQTGLGINAAEKRRTEALQMLQDLPGQLTRKIEETRAKNPSDLAITGGLTHYIEGLTSGYTLTGIVVQKVLKLFTPQAA